LTPSDRDPFEPLDRLPDPEPDPEVMRANIAASREAFARRAATAKPLRQGWWARLRETLSNPSGWLVPAGVGAFAAVMAIAVLPGVLTQPAVLENGQRQQATSESARERAAPAMAEAPSAAADAEALAVPATPQADAGVRFGAAPAPAPAEPPTFADVDPGSLEIHAEDDIRLGYRLEDGFYSLFMLTDEGALAMDARAVDAETISILDALRVPGAPGEAEILAVETQNGTEPPVWDAYRFAPTGISRDAELSALIADAPDTAEVEDRILESLADNN
jgi:hypothetical protein